MNKLTKNQGQTIALLINAMECSDIMMRSALEENRLEDHNFHHTNWENTVIELGEAGIELPNYELCVERKAIRATIKLNRLGG